MRFFRKKTPPPERPLFDQLIPLERDGQLVLISPQEFEKITGSAFIPQLDFEDFSLLSDIARKSEQLHKQGKLPREQLWLGSYFRTEILSFAIPGIFLRYIDPTIGWGVFAARDFQKMEFIAEYSGKLRRRKRSLDQKNAYCFEYILAPGIITHYAIDARDQGGIGRFINHSSAPNLLSTLATVDHIPHIVLITNETIPKGTQLCYDYGSDYWSHRTAPKNLASSQG